MVVLTVGIGWSTTATAQPIPEPDPTLPADPGQYLLGQHPVPAAPGTAPNTLPNLAGVTNERLHPQYLEPSAPGAGEIFHVAPGSEQEVLSRGDFTRRLWHLYQGGYLHGGLLGQVPQDQLGAPLPGTAPPPGAALPPGPVVQPPR